MDSIEKKIIQLQNKISAEAKKYIAGVITEEELNERCQAWDNEIFELKTKYE